jgi:hydrogenase maturation factor
MTVTPPPLDAVDDVADDLAAAALGLARRFAAGGTMWTVAPQWPAHGRHVAVEFVHPVIVGKKALPTVHLDDRDLVGSVRLLARPGDVVLVIGPADDRAVASVLRRAEAWGLTTLWVGAGPRPPAGAADHVLWVASDEAPGVLERSGAFVLLYHVLWELTHVVFEHPGLLTDPADLAAPDGGCTDDVCITCSDEGRVAEVAGVVDPTSAVVLAGGRRETIDTTLVGPVGPGDLVLVHAGTAISVVDDEGAP